MPSGKVRRRGGNLHHAVAEDIGARILKGEFAPGTLLPNEAEWCQAYKVSRTAVREAIRMLAAKGLVVSRPKIGSRVEPRERWNLLDREVLGWYGAAMDPEKFLISIQQMRRIVEPEAAALAARNHTARQMKTIEEAMEAMRTLTVHEEVVAADVRFHLAILAAAGNEFLVPLGFLIDSALASVFDYTRRRNDDPYYALPLHEAIVTAIRRRKPEQARLAAKRLLSDTDSVIDRSRRSLHRQTSRKKGQPRFVRATETPQGT
jgi:DNA-binding FadR family transcriptional regulator